MGPIPISMVESMMFFSENSKPDSLFLSEPLMYSLASRKDGIMVISFVGPWMVDGWTVDRFLSSTVYSLHCEMAELRQVRFVLGEHLVDQVLYFPERQHRGRERIMAD